MSPLDDLNPTQREAVSHRDGPLLVLAGPGSGKTRVITRRIARLIESGVSPARILAITFTNKAANEMQSRVDALLPGSRVWVSTFHRLCARLLRRYGSAVGLKSNFSIFDTTDQTQLVREVLVQQELDPKHYTPAKMLHRIGQAKHRVQSAEEYARAVAEGAGSYLDQITARVYTAYEAALLRANAVDFDDLLLHVCRLLTENDEIRRELDDRFRYILVDEYQDTNLAQYTIVRLLSVDHPNLCATGDPDQSIYGWRGAEIGNILRFEHDFPDARIVRLEQNYRSTRSILASADALIAHNVRRKAKSLFTENDEGYPVELLTYDNQTQEAEQITNLICQLAQSEARPWSDFAVFYRINALSRGLELALIRRGVPYQVAAGVAFYERSEVKDVLSYLRLIHNPADRAAFQRIVNVPTRGIGKQSIAKVLGWADQQEIAPLEAARRASEFPGIPKRAATALARFAELIEELSRGSFGGVAPLIETLLHRTGYTAEWAASKTEVDLQRIANVEELKTATRQYDVEHADDPTLEGFLESASLVADADAVDEQAGRVTLMTLHAAKGLEFPVAFVMAVEEGLLPHDRSLRDESLAELEEERRLLFVGATRAKERLFLSRTFLRDFRGQQYPAAPSRFLSEMKLQAAPRRSADVESAVANVALPAERNGPPSSDADTQAEEGHFVTEATTPALSPLSTGSRSLRRHTGVALTTGADLLAAATARPRLSFAAGMLVRHPRLGLGRVVDVQGAGKWRTVTVQFESSETQRFVAQQCPLQPVGAG
ncbi:MAG: ATP-dependent helicase [Planctomycetaceae bacterium]